ncbi:endonuclease/exonuclease/phosphatase family protein [Myroides pelagicus]|uniref:endonuclease/exonuclease/phosphatase family protein n=1 Tax=Myroides pelagicus TaxID=270914 RepID=UPI002DB7A39B|nr:endonuclease/exonuclease/phosphatase family protein [Myroides pelagicus]MEC4115239.1 endonuclease/exonuclease/phosphatase family protein [Myroides pelagicus]
MKFSFYLKLMLILFLYVSCQKDDVTIENQTNTQKLKVEFILEDLNQLPITNAQIKIYNYKSELVDFSKQIEIGTYQSFLLPNSYIAKIKYLNSTLEKEFQVYEQENKFNIILKTSSNNIIKQNSPIIITGIASDPRGRDGAASGTTSTYQNGEIIIKHHGGYEYIQLLALQDIDFTKTPYSIVFANNGKATDKGWAEGLDTTYKIDLISGKADKGTFFYVGGKSKVISGYGSCGKSTDISHANWIATKDYAIEAGDQFGNPTTSLLGNLSKSGENTADAIAVFKGTHVDSKTKPIDAVFYGTSISITYNSELNQGYLIPESSDIYSSTNTKNGEKQPYFGQGTNTHLFDQPRTDKGDFITLGGNTTDQFWLAPRKSHLITLSYCPGESSLSNIESTQTTTLFQGKHPSNPPESNLPKDSFKVMSFNIRNDNATDPQPLSQRKDLILKVIETYNPDIFGVQEFSNSWFIEWFKLKVQNLGYDYYIDTTKGTLSPKAIFYKKDRFILSNSKTFLMQFTELRSGTWVILKDLKNNQSYFVSNSHWTTTNSKERLESAKIVIDQVQKHNNNLPTIILGDFNAQPNSEEIKLLVNNTNPKLISSIDDQHMTFHNWSSIGKSRLDYLFHTQDFELNKQIIIRDTYSENYPSDHWPIMAIYTINK